MSRAETTESRVAAVLRRYEPSDTTLKLFREAVRDMDDPRMAAAVQKPAAFVILLAREGDPADAVEFLARWLPPRQRIWWGCLVLWYLYRHEPPAAVEATLAALVRWVEEPTDENRRAVRAAGDVLGSAHPAGALALAAFWSGGSMSAPHLPEVLPPPDLSPQAMTSTIRLAVHSQPLDRSQALHQYFVRLGLDVAAEPMHWDLAALRSE
jgi:hypothetical protein